jgi:hypothetical protein
VTATAILDLERAGLTREQAEGAVRLLEPFPEDRP